MFRVVLDTCILTAALRSRSGAGNLLLRQVAMQRIRPLVSPALFFEYEAVLKRPEHRLRTGWSLADTDAFLSAFASACEPIELSYVWRPQLRDPADEMVLELAINGRADALVTYNLRDFSPAAESFGLRVCRPGDVLQEISHA